MWKVLGGSVIGDAHVEEGGVCQDFGAWTVGEHALCIAVADGAGSQPRSHEGARAATEAALAWAEALDASVAELDDLGDGFRAARAALERLARESECELRELACTLTVVLAGAEHVWLGSVGDCIVVGERAGAIESFIPAERGEYLNEADFLTADGWEDTLRVQRLEDERLSACAVSTDGLQFKILSDVGSGAAYAPFFEDVFAWAATPRGNSEDLLAFLADLDAQSGDDKTLLIAVAEPDTCAPPDAGGEPGAGADR